MNKDELLIWHEMDGAGDKSIVFIEEICREITQSYGVKFRFECMNITPYIDRLNHLEREVEKPDIIFIPQDLVSLEGAKLSEVPEVYKQYMSPKLWNSMKYKGVQRGVPYLQGNHAVIYYNKNYHEDPPTCFDEIMACHSGGVHKFAMDLKVAYWVVPFLYTANGDPLLNNQFQLQKDVPQTVVRQLRRLQERNSLYDCEAISTMLEEFLAGKIAAMINGEWLYEYLLEHMGEDLGVWELPRLDGQDMRGVSSSVGVAFPWNSLWGEKQEALDIFIRYMLSEDVQRRWLEEHRRFPVNPYVLEHFDRFCRDTNMQNSCRQMQKNYFLKNEDCVKVLWKTCDRMLETIRHS
ncbi:MAG: extracellular solute-binding protein [Lachnospiraceae bacterium]|nr:extracellular solute-binding protein [Lachnospiraceae bacterium]